MNTKDFIKILKRVIKDEVRTVIKEELKAIKPIINEYSGGPYEGAGDLSKPSKDALRHRPIPKTGQVGIKGMQQTEATYQPTGTGTDQFVKDYSDTLAKSIAITSGNNK